jgi:diadenosine tetraphosphatase ApaH/serine/threonine PP2A family protein phosphatase
MVFLGDYVDRGAFSCEVMLYLLAAKIRYPTSVFLLRGNHESRKATKSYGSQAEFIFKYGKKFSKKLTDCFDHLPVYALITSKEKRILCMHGGISEATAKLDDTSSFQREAEPSKVGPLKDALWADPFEDLTAKNPGDMADEYDLGDLEEHTPKAKKDKEAFHDSSRGKGIKTFGYPAILNFLAKNDLVGIFRGHEQKETGLEQYKYGPQYKFPSVTTVFSAPNYTDKSKNRGAVVHVTNGIVKFRTFTWALHPQFFPWDFKGKEGQPFERDMDSEDFIQFVNFNHHEALRAIPLYKLKGEYLAMFEKAGDHPDNAERIRKAVDGGGSFGHKRTMREVDDEERDQIRDESRKMLKRYEGYDHFKDAVEKEEAYEKDPEDHKKSKQAHKEIVKRDSLASSATKGIKLPALSGFDMNSLGFNPGGGKGGFLAALGGGDEEESTKKSKKSSKSSRSKSERSGKKSGKKGKK